MKDTLNNKSICVLGMHRSGTSAVTRALNLIGVYLGEQNRIIEPLDDNPKGFWEHTGIIDIHERILTKLSTRWYDIWPLENEWWKLEPIAELKEDLKKLLIREFSDKPYWGWKDPRTCLTLPLWNEISKELDFETRYLIVIRNPIDTVNSLMKRNKFSLNQSYLLWQLYTLSALEKTKNTKRVIVSYDEFLSNWKPSLLKASKALDIPWSSDNNHIDKEMESFLDKSLRHSHSSLDDLSRYIKNADLPESISMLYELCVRALDEEKLINSSEFNSEITRMYSEHIKYSLMIKSEVHTQIDQIKTKHNQKLKDKDNLIKNLTKQNENKMNAINEKNHLIQQKEELIHDREKTIFDMTNTWSWEITKPLRWIADQLSKF
jgi:hypothetical protein